MVLWLLIGGYLIGKDLFYMISLGNYVVLVSILNSCRADCSVSNFSTRSTCDLSTNQRMAIYSSTTVVSIILNFIRGILLYFLCINASRVLHNRMFAAVLRAPILFFGTNPSG